jgi:hypothetical protein
MLAPTGGVPRKTFSASASFCFVADMILSNSSRSNSSWVSLSCRLAKPFVIDRSMPPGDKMNEMCNYVVLLMS